MPIESWAFKKDSEPLPSFLELRFIYLKTWLQWKELFPTYIKTVLMEVTDACLQIPFSVSNSKQSTVSNFNLIYITVYFFL